MALTAKANDLTGRQLLVNALQNPVCLSELPLAKWDTLIRLARVSNLIGRLAEAIDTVKLTSHVPDKALPHLVSARLLANHQRQAIRWEVKHLGDALNSLDAPKVLLKGAAYAVQSLEAAGGRVFGDLDLLVPKTAIPAAEAALMLKGWGAEGVDSYDQRYYREWMHEIPPMVHRGRGTVVDLHHNILPLTARYCPTIELFFADAVPSSVPGFQVLSPVDMVIHSATHLFYESEMRNGLRDLFDLDALIRQFSRDRTEFWPLLAERTDAIGLNWPVFLALSCLRDILGAYVPEEFFQRIRVNANLGSMPEVFLTKLYYWAVWPKHPLIDNLPSRLSRFLVYIRGHYLRMPLRLLLPHLSRKALGRLYKSGSGSDHR
ncbi:nucleotidyltransferase family protein [Methylomonas sp. SURF-1]|uniref:Nucleotidyltransferase family protein n=1 Tax=Methylomonas aurea TaxID=2952224 RepID=A0ABT1UDL1_9GAMM|nr:nucleotidyltransferase family protein [Methylomonas sp. SURF-1]MCQ8180322.1 nucleotidyltransferase family protein [Methylomonas sp. SURF-1]